MKNLLFSLLALVLSLQIADAQMIRNPNGSVVNWQQFFDDLKARDSIQIAKLEEIRILLGGEVPPTQLSFLRASTVNISHTISYNTCNGDPAVQYVPNILTFGSAFADFQAIVIDIEDENVVELDTLQCIPLNFVGAYISELDSLLPGEIVIGQIFLLSTNGDTTFYRFAIDAANGHQPINRIFIDSISVKPPYNNALFIQFSFTDTPSSANVANFSSVIDVFSDLAPRWQAELESATSFTVEIPLYTGGNTILLSEESTGAAYLFQILME